MPSNKRERESTWPTESSLWNKLHGKATDLTYAWRCGSSPSQDHKYNKSTSNAEKEEELQTPKLTMNYTAQA